MRAQERNAGLIDGFFSVSLAQMNTGTVSKTASRADFYQTHLDRVSRSFAFCIARLEEPLRAQVGLSYLICRILDTIEDAEWREWTAQERAFLRFESFLTDDQEVATEVARWVSNFPEGLAEGERLLLADAGDIFADFHALPETIRSFLRDAVLSMSRGMRYFLRERSGGDGGGRSLHLKTLSDVNRYCFFVAGIVGEVLTRLLTEQCDALGVRPAEFSPRVLEDGFRFGLFLQKVNLLKDQRSDEVFGRFLVPDRPVVFQSLLEDARFAIRYIVDLPRGLASYRLFCAWSLFLGLASLPWIERSFQDNAPIKIPRVRTQELLAQIETVVEDPDALPSFFDEWFAAAREVAPPPSDDSRFESSPPEPTDLELADVTAPAYAAVAALYRGALPESELRVLLGADARS